MASFNFPTSPTNGDTYTLNGVTYEYNSVKTRWEVKPNSWDIGDYQLAIGIIRMHPSTLAEDATIPSGYNAFSAGPLEIETGYTVTINDNANWSII
jgi:hypothetical protein